MFNNSKYTKWYFSIINSRKMMCRDCFMEKHHIIPKCMGGSNTADNIVKLTPREHFVCHKLLFHMVDLPKDKRKMSFALIRMKTIHSNGDKHRCNSHQFEQIRRMVSDYISKENNPFYGKGHFGADNPMSDLKNRETHLNAVNNPAYKKLLSELSKGEKNAFYGKTHSEETKHRLSELASLRIGEKSPRFGKKHKIVECEWCKKSITYPMYRRWHGENCKKHS